jgi:hypothetical protein
MLADDLLADAKTLAARGVAETRESCMRRALSTAYYSVFHLLLRCLGQTGSSIRLLA